MRKKTVQTDPLIPPEVPAPGEEVTPAVVTAPAPEGEQETGGENTNEIKPRLKLSRMVVLLLIGIPVVLLLLVGGYFLSGYIVAQQIDKSYSAGNCTKVVSLGGTAKSIYSPAIMPYVAPALAQVSECQPYVQAVEAQDQENWETAYAGYAGYLESYPQGIVAPQSQEAAAEVLYSWAAQLEGQQDYAAAQEKLSLLLKEYENSPMAGDARESMARVLLEWAKALQGTQDYTNSADKLETILETYEDTSSAEEARALLPHVYLAWANDDIARGEFTPAMKLFDSAERYADAELKIEITAARVSGEMAWAEQLSGEGQFNSSLDHLDTAEEMSPDDSFTANITALRTQVLEEFSGSTGTEAQKFMRDATRSLCTNRVPAALPILGINSEEVRIFSATLNLPATMEATTPGNLHYVTCVSDRAITIETCAYQGGHTLYRQRLDRVIELVNASTGRTFATQTFTGGTPATCQSREWFSGPNLYKTGAPPSDAQLIGWLSQFTK